MNKKVESQFFKMLGPLVWFSERFFYLCLLFTVAGYYMNVGLHLVGILAYVFGSIHFVYYYLYKDFVEDWF